MNEESDPPRFPANNGEGAGRRILWLLTAFVPSVIGTVCFQLKNIGSWLLPVLILLTLICCVAASVGLVRGMKNKAAQPIVGLLLIPFFIGLNVLIVLFIGCSGMGRIAP